MKRLSTIIFSFIIFILSSYSVCASESSSVFFNDAKLDNSVYTINDNSAYILCSSLKDIFGINTSVEANGTYIFSSEMRKVTYDISTGNVSVSDTHSFSNITLPSEAYFLYNNDVYIPLELLCKSFEIGVEIKDNNFYLKSSGFSVGLYNEFGTAIAYKNGKYAIVDKSGNAITNFEFDDITNYDRQDLFKIKQNHRCGMYNGYGKKVLDSIYNAITYYSDSEVYLEINNKLGMCDYMGEIIIPVVYDNIMYCGNMIAMVKDGKVWSLLNCANGQISDAIYDDVYKITPGVQTDNSMIEGYYVQKKDKWGCIDSFGNIVIEIKYDMLDKFDINGRARYILNGKFGIIDCGGKIIIPPAYDYIYPFGSLSVTVAKAGYKYGVIDTFDNIIMPFIYDYLYPFDNKNTTVAYKDGFFGIISSSGQNITEFNYAYLENFSDGAALAYEKGRGYGYIDYNGNKIIDCVHSDIKQGTSSSVFLKKDGSWALYSLSGEDLSGFVYNSASGFSNGLSAVSKNIDGNVYFGYVNETNDTIIPFIYQYAQPFKYGKAIVNKDGTSGIIDIEGNTVIPFLYYGFNPSYDYNVIAAANALNKWGLISSSNKKLSDFVYDYIFEFQNGYAIVLNKGKYAIMSVDGNLADDFIYKDYDSALEAIHSNTIKKPPLAYKN